MRILFLVILLSGCATTPPDADAEYERADHAIMYQERYLRYLQGCNEAHGNVRIIRSGRSLPRQCLYSACPARVGDTYLCVGQ